MKKENLVHGEIYFQDKYVNNYVVNYLFFLNKDDNEVKFLDKGFINITEKKFNNWGGTSGNDFNTIKEASELEKAWLLECVKQNKFIPLKKIKLPQNEWLWNL